MSYQNFSPHSSDDFFQDGMNLDARQSRTTYTINETNIKRFKSLLSRPQHSPHPWSSPTFGAGAQLTPLESDSPPANPNQFKRLQELTRC